MIEHRLEERTTGAIVFLRLISNHDINPFTANLLRDLDVVVERLAGSPARVVVLEGGPKNFSGGAYLPELAEMDAAAVRRHVEFELDLCERIEQLPQVTVVGLRGGCVGNGLELALACDVLIAATDATIRMPEIRLGFPAPVGRLSRCMTPARVREFVLSGRAMSAGEAASIGVISRCVAPDELDAALASAAADYSQLARPAVTSTKHILRSIIAGENDVRSLVLNELQDRTEDDGA